MERTLIIFKPDTLQRMLVGRILQRFEDKGLRIVAMKLQQSPRAQVEQHYCWEARLEPFGQLLGFTPEMAAC